MYRMDMEVRVVEGCTICGNEEGLGGQMGNGMRFKDKTMNECFLYVTKFVIIFIITRYIIVLFN